MRRASADLSKKAKQVLYEFHKKHEPNPILRWTRQAVWNWRRMDPGMMTRNALLLYAFFLADFHYNEAKRAREVTLKVSMYSNCALFAREEQDFDDHFSRS